MIMIKYIIIHLSLCDYSVSWLSIENNVSFNQPNEKQVHLPVEGLRFTFTLILFAYITRTFSSAPPLSLYLPYTLQCTLVVVL